MKSPDTTVVTSTDELDRLFAAESADPDDVGVAIVDVKGAMFPEEARASSGTAPDARRVGPHEDWHAQFASEELPAVSPVASPAAPERAMSGQTVPEPSRRPAGPAETAVTMREDLFRHTSSDESAGRAVRAVVAGLMLLLTAALVFVFTR